MTKKILKLTLILSILSLNAYGADSSSGCGPGWYILKENTILSSTLRSTTHAILLPTVTIGMTLGTSNCSKHKLVKTEKESLQFATDNYFEIAVDTSRGQGEFLSSFAETIGCKKEDIKLFQDEMKKNFSNIYDKNHINPTKMLRQTYILILNSPALTRSCSLS